MTADVRELIWRQASEHLFVTREQYMADLDQWEIEPIEVAGEIAFAIMVKGAAIHLASFRTGHKFPLHAFKDRVQDLLDRHGHVETRTPKGETRQRALNEVFGFAKTGEDDYDVHYRLDRIRSATERSA